jgi:hypothetical protein
MLATPGRAPCSNWSITAHLSATTADISDSIAPSRPLRPAQRARYQRGPEGRIAKCGRPADASEA